MTTRDQIIEAADRLFYERGYEHTSFTDIAADVGISRGNFYYHYKTKDEILDAVITQRLENTRAMLERWQDEGGDPRARIRCFIQMLIRNQASIAMHGCPVGTLATEMAKLGHAARPRANELFTLFRAWLAHQFKALGHKKDADALAMHLLARTQGVALLANAFHDTAFLQSEVRNLTDWLDQL